MLILLSFLACGDKETDTSTSEELQDTSEEINDTAEA